jgi:hypothetical protein
MHMDEVLAYRAIPLLTTEGTHLALGPMAAQTLCSGPRISLVGIDSDAPDCSLVVFAVSWQDLWIDIFWRNRTTMPGVRL